MIKSKAQVIQTIQIKTGQIHLIKKIIDQNKLKKEVYHE